MSSWVRYFVRHAVSLHPLSWLAMLFVFAGFMWLNFNTTKVTYLAHTSTGWHGGLREGFPIPWWDGGKEAACVVTDDGPKLSAVPYGGWQLGGVALGVLVLSLSLAGTAYLTEQLVKRFSGPMFNAVAESFPLQRRMRIRLLTGLISLIMLATVVSLNLITTVSVSGPVAERRTVAFSESMGWPFPTYVAGEPVLINPDREVGYVMTAKQAASYLETHEPIWWRQSHWNTSGIVLNTVSALLLILGSACICEWVGKRSAAAAQNVS
jgi:hypothetical protein